MAMGATGVSRRQPPPPPPPSSCVPRSPDLDGTKNPACTGDSEARGITSPLSLPAAAAAAVGLGDPWRLRLVFVLFACLSLTTLAFVSGAYTSPLAFLSAVYGSTTLPQQQQPPTNISHEDLKHPTSHSQSLSSSGNLLPHGANHSYAEGTFNHTGELSSSRALLPATFTGNSSVIELPNGAAVAPSSPSETSHVKLHNGATAVPLPTSSGRLSEAELGKGAAGDTSPSAITASSSDAHDKLLGGLLATGFDEQSCLSRYQSASYRRASPHKPSPFLMESLRRYEALHSRCGPRTSAYKKSLPLLRSGHGGASFQAQCKYLVWVPENGLGNRMISLASAFLYALLADRVLLIDRSRDLGSLFCEPFLGSTWLLPLDFPLKVSTASFNQKHPSSYGNMLRNTATTTSPTFVYTHLSHDYDDNDKRFFCEADQSFLQKVPWMVMRSDQYFVPALFLVPAFRRQLDQMFPQKEAVFHHLGRYLFHPSNGVWGLITRYYQAHLATAREVVGIQIRVHFRKEPPFELITRQILNCTWTQKLLPPTTNGSSMSQKAVVLTSLYGEFLTRLEAAYRPRHGAAAVRFHQPSQEGRQQTGREVHDGKALAEMYLLSMAEELVTSAWSTFGYVAQGLGGISPWILRGPVHTSMPERSCTRAASMEPCFHYPPNYNCRVGGYMDTGKVLPFTRKCRDRKGGLKLVDGKRRV